MSCRSIAAALIALAAGWAPSRASAQGAAPACMAGMSQPNAQGACELAADFARYLSPQLAGAVAGGSASPGGAGALGRFGRFSIGARVNAFRGSVPQLVSHSASGAGTMPSSYPMTAQWSYAPVVDAAVGVFGGADVGGARVGGVDLLGSVGWVAESRHQGSVRVDQPGGTLHASYGVRVGLLTESFATPGASVSFIRRELPAVDVLAHLEGGRSEVRDLKVATTAWRATVGKQLLGLGLLAGAGQDRHAFGGWARGTTYSEMAVEKETVARVDDAVTRTTFFGGASVDLFGARVVGELGRASGGSLRTVNRFAKPVQAAWTYASVGVRVVR